MQSITIMFDHNFIDKIQFILCFQKILYLIITIPIVAPPNEDIQLSILDFLNQETQLMWIQILQIKHQYLIINIRKEIHHRSGNLHIILPIRRIHLLIILLLPLKYLFINLIIINIPFLHTLTYHSRDATK